MRCESRRMAPTAGPPRGWARTASLALALLAAGAPPEVRAATSDARALAVLDRVSWGRSDADAAAVTRLGVDRWLDRQLHPTADDGRASPAAQAAIDALPVSHTPMARLVVSADAQNKAANQIADPDQKKAAQQAYQQGLGDLARQAATRSLLRDLYAPDQLREQMTWFWFNHFNVHQYKRDVRAMVADYEDQAIRPHALGRFRDLLEATLRHPAMLRYLDNDQNAANHINENYAREIMELHTLGVGSSYTQHDVQELARILTGVGVDLSPTDPKLAPARQPLLVRAGLFEFNPNRHDFGDKLFLGHAIKGSGFGEVEQALDLLARDPATAHHVCTQLAVYFVSDGPPPELVDAMAGAWKRSDGDIATVLRTMFRSRAFTDSLGRKFKDPVHYAVSSVRLAYGDRVVLNTNPLQGWLNRMGEGLYNHETPDGYPMTEPAWNGPGQLAVRFEIARQIGGGSAGLFKPDGAGATDAPAFPQLQNALYFESGQAALGARPRRRCRRRARRRSGTPCSSPPPNSCVAEEVAMNRREMLAAGLAGGSLVSAGRVFAAPNAGDQRLLVVFLRGAYDAANVVVPTGSEFYYQARPTLQIKRPDPSDPNSALPLDADWSLHPALKDTIYPLWGKKQIAFVPFAGADDLSRSHFETQDAIELGQGLQGPRDYNSGFMGRLYGQLQGSRPIAFTDQLPLTFRGGAAVPNIGVGGVGKPGVDDRQAKLIEEMYAGQTLGASVSQGFAVRDEVYRSVSSEMVAANKGAVSAKGFELSGRRIGRLMRTDYTLGFVDVGGWDTHVNQGAAQGYLASRLGELGRGLAGFVDEIGPDAWARTTVVVVSEFGRTFRENGDRGTDHGHGSVYWVMGGAVKGGRIAGPQVAVTQATLNQNRDWPVLTDYRGLIGGLAQRAYGLDTRRLDAVFPGARPADLELT